MLLFHAILFAHIASEQAEESTLLIHQYQSESGNTS
jgi:hypothetical protein